MWKYFAKRIRFALIAALLVVLFIPPITQAEEATPVMVFAAASTTNAVNEIGTLFKEKGGAGITSSFASSSTLAKQMEQGAPASIFISADEDWMNYLSQRKLIAEDSRVNLLGNSLVLIAPASSRSGKYHCGKRTRRFGRKRPDCCRRSGSRPRRQIPKAALVKLNIWKDIEPRLARASDVGGHWLWSREVRPLTESVYSTDAAITKKVKIVGQFLPDLYPSSRLSGSPDSRQRQSGRPQLP